jgi:Transposase C of IS166 homeodomain
MNVTPGLPHDPGQGQRLLDDLLRRNDELRQQAQDAQRRIDELERLLEQDHLHQLAEAARQQAEDAQRRIDELERVLEQTAANYQQLQQQHDELAETLALLRRYLFGQRRERFTDDPGQGHLFDIPEILTEPEPTAPPPADDGRLSRPRRPAHCGKPVWIISLTSASSMICPRARRLARAAAVPNNASARTSPANSISSRRSWR